MDKSLHLFDTEAEFQAKYWSGEYEEPWVSLTDENGNVKFNKSEYERMLEAPLTFEITGAGDICWLFINNSGNGEAKTLEYKKNDGNWTEITSTTGGSKISVSVGDEVQFRGDNVGMSYSSTTLHYRNEFSGTTAEFKVKGNIMSLLDKDDFLDKRTFDQGAEFAFFLLFNACSGLTDASNLVLPATALTASCYRSMFQQCTNLVYSPEDLPATVLAENCYRTMFPSCPSLETAPKSIGDADTVMAPYACYNMFQNAVNLTKTPELPATTMAAYCYYGMFNGCTSLSRVPEVLPATTLAERCYQFMFYGTNITKAPEIFATTLALRCCDGMFRNCTNLRSAPSELPATTMAEMCYQQMFRDCTSLTTAPELPATVLANSCYYHMFGGCVKLKNAPELPASELAESCYSEMFYGCTSLGSSPTLSATTLAASCYALMFYGCTNLTVGPPILPAATMYANTCKNMFYGCTKLRNAPRLPATTIAAACYEQMFYNCSSLLYAQTELPALALGDYCYKRMFAGCSSIKVSPALPASVVPTGAYMDMFSGCSQLNYIKCLAADISATNSTTNWTKGVAATGRFEKSPAMGNWTNGVNGIPVNWTVEQKSKITVIPTTLTFEYTGGTQTLTIQSTGNWTAVASDSWIQLSTASGSYLTTSITITTDQAVLGRSGSVTLTTGNKTARVDVVQNMDPNQPLSFLVTSAGDIKWATTGSTASDYRAIEYSKNGGAWTEISSSGGGATISVVADDVIRFRSPAGVTYTTMSNTATTPNSFSGTTCEFKVYGSVYSLLDGANFASFSAITGAYAFKWLFAYCTGMTDASDLKMSTAVWGDSCFQEMFLGCSSLLNAPTILSGETLAANACRNAFAECTVLTGTPILPALTLAEGCYRNMFRQSPALTTAPELPAPTLVANCYYQMFNGCTALNYVKCLATNISASGATTNWLYSVAASGTFVRASSSVNWGRNANGAPSGWTLQNNA